MCVCEDNIWNPIHTTQIEVNESNSFIKFIWNFHQNIHSLTHTNTPLFNLICAISSIYTYNSFVPLHTHHFTYFHSGQMDAEAKHCCYFFLFTFWEISSVNFYAIHRNIKLSICWLKACMCVSVSFAARRDKERESRNYS